MGSEAPLGVTLPEEAMNQDARSSHQALDSAATLVLLLALAALPALGQEAPGQEPLINEDDATLPETSLGNVVQTARFHYDSGVRMMKQAAKLEAKAAEAETLEKRAKREKKVASLREGAIGQFQEAIGYNSGMLEAYAGLGAALSEIGRPDQALQVHARALGLEPEDEENFHGWAQALLDLNMLGDATQAYTSMREARPKKAATLLALMKSWLAEKRTDPGELEPSDLERLATWISDQEDGTG
jgi:tetratricopeptide (TPR) repeat protein